MDYIGSWVPKKELATVCITAFLTGGICFFDGMFPAALAFMTAMLSVSTVYIYLLPLVAGAMALSGLHGIFFYGDMAALILLSLFFLFFHHLQFSVNQRTGIGIVAIALGNMAAFAWEDMLFFLRPEMLAMEMLAFCIYVRVWNLVTRILYGNKPVENISIEMVSLSLEILLVSFIAIIRPYEVAFALWELLAMIILYEKGLKEAFSLTAVSAVCSFCLGETLWQLYAWLFAALLSAFYISAWIDRPYKKIVTGLVVFLFLCSAESTFVYGTGVAVTAFMMIPDRFFTKAACAAEERFMPAATTEKDLQYMAIERNLQKKKEAFLDLGSLYGRELEGKQILSYQFAGMARTIEKLQADLHGKKARERTDGICLTKVAVGQASYSSDEVSGDSMAAFTFDDHRLALVISDGMGKGREAAAESRMVVTTLSKLLQAGFDVDLAMKTVNGILMACCDEERFATVDLAIIDRAKCRAKIYKMGAATTFIKHDGRVSMLKRQALPAGITGGPDLEYIDIKLKRGDLLVMVSDGVTDCDRKDPGCDWLRERLLQMGSRDPETVAELVVNKAAEKYGIRERDDLSVMTAAIDV